jgi:o-succinylbenzoate---CoA ligase
MNNLIEQLNHNNQNKWLVNSKDLELNYLFDKTLEFYEIFKKLKEKKQQVNIFIVETDILIFISAFLAGISAKCNVFLGNTQWQEEEWKQVFNLVNPDLIIESFKPDKPYQLLIDKGKQTHQNKTNLDPDQSYIMIPTGGTSGKIKFAIHSWETLTNSVMAFANYFQVKSINSYCVLPLYHVSGLMQFIRSFLTNGKLNYLDYKTLKKSDFSSFNQEDYFISLVPTQLQYLITKNPQWLGNFYTILLGGAKPWTDLLNLARKYQLNLAPVYGMTETASQIVALKPQDFLLENNSNGKVLNHSKIKIKNSSGEVLNFNQTGIITIESKSLCLGYYPHLFENNQVFVTDDLGYFDPQGYLYITGRNSQKIITGGENVNPTEVENAILATNLVKDICIIGIWDPKWGEAVTAIYVPINHQVSDIMIKESIKDKLALFKQPKNWFVAEEIPRNLQGKINYEQIKKLYKFSENF